MKRSFADSDNSDTNQNNRPCTKDFLNRLVNIGKNSSISSTERVNSHELAQSNRIQCNQTYEKLASSAMSPIKTITTNNQNNSSI